MLLARRAVTGVLWCVVAAVVLVVGSGLAGGPVGWLVTSGASMLPDTRPGTLVVVRAQDGYDVGDVVAYRNQDLGSVVLHRVVGVDGDRLVLQGDANSWVDPFRPGPQDVLGSRVLAVPGLGSALHAVRDAAPVGLVAGVVLLVLWSRRTGRAGDVLHGGPERRRTPPLPTAGSVLPDGARPAATTGLLACVALAALTVLLPAAVVPASTASAAVDVDLAYGATVPVSAAYPDGRLGHGQPVFTRVVPELPVTARLALHPAKGTRVEGRWHLRIVLGDASGWQAPVWDGPRLPLRDGGTARATVVPAALLALGDDVARTTGVPATGRTVSVQAVLEGSLVKAGRSTPLPGSPSLDLSLDGAVLRPAPTAPAPPVPQTATATPSRDAVALGPLAVPVRPLRVLSGVGALGCLAVLLLALGAGRPDDGPDGAPDGDRVLETAPVALVPPVVDVRDLRALTALADRYDRLVLTWEHDGGRTWVVQDDGTSYRWTAPRVVVPLPRVSVEDRDRQAAG